MQIVQSAYTFIEAKIDKIQNKIASKQHINDKRGEAMLKNIG
jgi:hypothetical protein